MSKIRLDEIQLRILGYYNNPDQRLNPEEEDPVTAGELAQLLKRSFANVEDPNEDTGFAEALRTGVFVMRDRDSHLYAYWPREGEARVSNVEISRDPQVFQQLPLEYKYWFSPGGPIEIGRLGTANNISKITEMYDYLRQLSTGKQVAVYADFLPQKSSLHGEMAGVGRDFFSIKTAEDDIYLVSKHLCVQLNPTLAQQKAETVGTARQEEPELLSALGTVTKYNPVANQGTVKATNGVEYYLKYENLLDKRVRQNSKVVFTPLKTISQKTKREVRFANFVHLSDTVDNALRLAERLAGEGQKQAAKEVLKHIRNEYPDNEEAQDMQERLAQVGQPVRNEEAEGYARMYQEACKRLEHDDDKRKALELFQELIEAGSHVKDSITKASLAYQQIYASETDEDAKALVRAQMLTFIEDSAARRTPSAALNFRLQNYYKLGEDELYLRTIDESLESDDTGNARRARLYNLRAMKMMQRKANADQVQQMLEKSLQLSPFNNKAELHWSHAVGDADCLPTVPQKNNIYGQFLLSQIVPSDADGEQVNLDVVRRGSEEYQRLLFKKIAQLHINGDDDREELTSLLAEYTAMRAADNALERNFDSALFLWRELFKSIEGMGYFVQSCLTELLSAVTGVAEYADYDETADTQRSRKTWQEVMAETNGMDERQWSALLGAVCLNKTMLRAIGRHVDTTPALRSSLQQYVSSLRLSADNSRDQSLMEFVAQQHDYSRTAETDAVRLMQEAIKDREKLADKVQALRDIKFDGLPFTALSAINHEGIALLEEDYLPQLDIILTEMDATERTNRVMELRTRQRQMWKSILQAPTYFLIRGIFGVTERIGAQFVAVEELSHRSARPELSVRITSDTVARTSDGRYHITGLLANAAGLMAAEDVVVEVRSKALVAQVEPLALGRVEGGASVPFAFDVSLAGLERKPGWGFAIYCTYTCGTESFSRMFTPLQMRFSQDIDFVAIATNPYTSGQALSLTDETFVGREHNIKELVDIVMHPQRPAQQLIVYGQKRCGKSSLVERVKKRLEEQYADRSWCVNFDLILDRKEQPTYTIGAFYYLILSKIQSSFDSSTELQVPEVNIPTRAEMEAADSPTELFCNCMIHIKSQMAATPGWEKRRLVVIIDEFTVLYNSIKLGVADQNILHYWKGIQETNSRANFATIFVGHDITPTFFAEPYATNAAAIIETYQLSYLDEAAARQLIEDPIWDKVHDRSRFSKEAISRIIYYTAGSPSYLQIFMRQMVNYINLNHVVEVTGIDVINVARGFVEKRYDNFQSIKDFDNLINSGLDDRFCTFTDQQFEMVLRSIASQSKGLEYCTRNSVAYELEANPATRALVPHLEAMLKDLDDRKVIERKENNHKLKIKVGLFKEWLNRN